MSNDGLIRKCPKCRGYDIMGPYYLPEDDRAKLQCAGCGFWWTRPTHATTQRELVQAQLYRGNENE